MPTQKEDIERMSRMTIIPRLPGTPNTIAEANAARQKIKEDAAMKLTAQPVAQPTPSIVRQAPPTVTQYSTAYPKAQEMGTQRAADPNQTDSQSHLRTLGIRGVMDRDEQGRVPVQVSQASVNAERTARMSAAPTTQITPVKMGTPNQGGTITTGGRTYEYASSDAGKRGALRVAGGEPEAEYAQAKLLAANTPVEAPRITQMAPPASPVAAVSAALAPTVQPTTPMTAAPAAPVTPNTAIRQTNQNAAGGTSESQTPQEYGGLMGAYYGGKRVFENLADSSRAAIPRIASSVASNVGSAVRAVPPVLNYLAGGERRLMEGEAQRNAPAPVDNSKTIISPVTKFSRQPDSEAPRFDAYPGPIRGGVPMRLPTAPKVPGKSLFERVSASTPVAIKSMLKPGRPSRFTPQQSAGFSSIGNTVPRGQDAYGPVY